MCRTGRRESIQCLLATQLFTVVVKVILIGILHAAYNKILVKETSRFINDHLEDRSEDPFFAYVALGSVHIPHSPPTMYSDGSPIAGEYPTAHMDLLVELDKVFGSLVSLDE